jgi:hypothetical protein
MPARSVATLLELLFGKRICSTRQLGCALTDSLPVA